MEIVSYSACNCFEQIVADTMWQPVVVGHSVKESMNTKMFFDRYNRSAEGFEKKSIDILFETRFSLHAQPQPHVGTCAVAPLARAAESRTATEGFQGKNESA